MNKLKTLAVLTFSVAALGTAAAADMQAQEGAADAAVQASAVPIELDRIVAVVNNDVITDR